MDVHFETPDLEAKIEHWVAETARTRDELIEDAFAGYFEELAQTQECSIAAMTISKAPRDAGTRRRSRSSFPRKECRAPRESCEMTGLRLPAEAITDLITFTSNRRGQSRCGRSHNRRYSRPYTQAGSVPQQGRKRPDLTSRPLQFTRPGEYLIAYAPDEKPRWVVAVLRGRLSPRVMAAILRGRE
jgi:hypothetical protein